MSNVTVPLDLDEKACCEMIEVYVRDNFSSASVEVFREHVGKDLFNQEVLTVAAGKALLNESIIDVIKLGIAADEL